MRKALTTMTVALVCTAVAACGGGEKGIKLGDEHKVGDDATYSIEAADQTSNGKAVKIPMVNFKEKGYVAIHSDQGGAPGPVLGVSELLNPGDTKGVRVKLDKPIEEDADIWPMLHIEDNANTTYDFPNGDAPAKADGQVVVVKVHVTVR